MRAWYERPWYQDPLMLVIGGLVALIVLGLVFAIRADAKFARFVREHHCVAVAQDPGYFVTYLTTMSCGTNCTMMLPQTYWQDGAKTWRCPGLEDFKR